MNTNTESLQRIIERQQWLPMLPNEGPPLPRKFGVYWPWYKAPAVFTCAECGQKFATYAEFQTHMTTAHPTLVHYTCPQCGRSFWSQAELDTHIKTAHPEVPPKYTLTLVASPPQGGRLSKSPDKSLYSEGERVLLAAAPASGYNFEYWAADGEWMANAKSFYFLVMGSHTVTAYFSSTLPPTGEWGKDFTCPYCGVTFYDATEYGRHIATHIGEAG